MKSNNSVTDTFCEDKLTTCQVNVQEFKESSGFFRRLKTIFNPFNQSFRQPRQAGNIIVVFQIVIVLEITEASVDLQQIIDVAETITAIGSLIVTIFGSFGK